MKTKKSIKDMTDEEFKQWQTDIIQGAAIALTLGLLQRVNFLPEERRGK